MRPPLSLKARALQWLAQREYAPQELRAKLLRAAAAAEQPDDTPRDEAEAAREVDALIDWLQAKGCLSAQRWVDGRIRSRAPRLGHRRIEHELRAQGLAPDPAALQALRASEFERACEVWRKKFGAAPPVDAAARLRQMRFLAGRGFSPEVVRRVVRAGGRRGDG